MFSQIFHIQIKMPVVRQDSSSGKDTHHPPTASNVVKLGDNPRYMYDAVIGKLPVIWPCCYTFLESQMLSVSVPTAHMYTSYRRDLISTSYTAELNSFNSTYGNPSAKVAEKTRQLCEDTMIWYLGSKPGIEIDQSNPWDMACLRRCVVT